MNETNTLSKHKKIIFFALLHVLFLLVFFTIISAREESRLQSKAKVDKPIAPTKPKPQLEDVLKKYVELKAKEEITAKMIMSCAVRLESFKNKPENRKDAAKQVVINDALNWCYENLGKNRIRDRLKYETA